MNARHVDEPVQTAEALDGGLHHRLAALLVGDVDLLQQQLVGGVLMGLAIVQGPQVGCADVHALMQQMIHAGAANAASRASDKKCPVFQV